MVAVAFPLGKDGPSWGPAAPLSPALQWLPSSEVGWDTLAWELRDKCGQQSTRQQTLRKMSPEEHYTGWHHPLESSVQVLDFLLLFHSWEKNISSLNFV